MVLVLDASKAIGGQDDYSRLRHGLFRLFSHVPAGTEVAVVTFGAKARINLGPTVVSEANREGLFGKIPFRLLDAEQGCVSCGLEAASEVIDGSAASILLVSATEEASISPRIASLVSERALPVFSVSLGAAACQDVIDLTSFGGSFALPRDFTASELASAFLSALNVHSAPEKRVSKTFEKTFSVSGDDVVSGNLVLDESLNKNAWMVLTSPHKEDVEVFEVTSPSGRRHVFPKYQNGIVFFHWKGVSEPGIWSYTAKLYQNSQAGRVPLKVEVVAEATSSDGVSVDAWTSVANGQAVDALEEPVVLYAEVRQGRMPVRGARVVAEVTRPGSDKKVEVLLRDSGTGYPDLTRGDGIYSAYFVDFTSDPGLYSITIRADHNDGEASIPKASGVDAPSKDCCGSALADNLYSIPTRAFQLHLSAPSFQVSQGVQFVINKAGEPIMSDVFAPSRVTDFAVRSYVNQTLYASLVWSAPGGDFDQGKAARYEIRCYTNQDALSSANFESMGIPVHESLLPAPAAYGTEQTATVGLPWANEIFFYGLVAVDAAGNRGPVSNLVPVFAREVSTTTNATTLLDVNGLSKLDSALSTAVMASFQSHPAAYIATGAVCGLVLILVLVSSALVYRRRKRAAAMRRKANLQRTQIFVNDIENNASASSTSGEDSTDAAPEKPPVADASYGPVWPASGSPTDSDDYLQQDYGLYKNVNMARFGQPSWSYQPGPGAHPTAAAPPAAASATAAQTAPVHEFRSAFNSVASDDTAAATANAPASGNGPTYQNWSVGKPPSDNGTATTSTSSTDCSESSSELQSERLRQQQLQQPQLYGAQLDYSGRQQQQQMDPSALSLSPSFLSSERRRRQESLV